MSKILVVSPHADDESLGCGGSILRHVKQGDSVHWLLATDMAKSSLYSVEQVEARNHEIEQVRRSYNFDSFNQLGFTPAALDTVGMGEVVAEFSKVIEAVRPEIVYSPFRNDAHTDHRVVFDAVVACTKSFRYPFVKRVLCYETISETEFGMKPEASPFKPNVYVDISEHLEEKLLILDIFDSEMGVFPFPRSRRAVEALANYRGSQSNCIGAEAFVLIKEIL